MGTGAYRLDDGEPDLPDVLGEEYYRPAVPVKFEGPARVQELPCPDGGARNYTLDSGANSAIEIAQFEPRRRRLIVISKDDDFMFGYQQTMVDSDNGAWWPKGQPLYLNTTLKVWANAFATNTLISVITELWTD